MKSDMTSPEISVVVPVYNGARFIPGILERLERQTYQNFEVIFVNDGSQDGTKAVLDQAASTPRAFRCHVIHQNNGGASAARNAGLACARGKYICFIDADDKISLDYLKVLRNALLCTGLRVAVAHMTRTENELDAQGAPEAKAVSGGDFLRKFLYRGSQYHLCACMFEKKCFDDLGLVFPEGFRYSEDVFVLWQIFAAEKEIAEADRCIYYYFYNRQSAMNAGIDIQRLDAITLMRKLEPIIAQRNPAFSEEFRKYAVARHHWSILWQAAAMLNSYQEFRDYCSHFQMRAELKRLLGYPQWRISLSSLLYLVFPCLYYILLRAYVRMIKMD